MLVALDRYSHQISCHSKHGMVIYHANCLFPYLTPLSSGQSHPDHWRRESRTATFLTMKGLPT